MNENNRTAFKNSTARPCPTISYCLKSPFCLSPQQAFNATAVVRHMRKLQLGTSQEGQGQTASRGELLAPAAGGENRAQCKGMGGPWRAAQAGVEVCSCDQLRSLFPCRAGGWLLLSRLLCGAQPRTVPRSAPPALEAWIQGQDLLCRKGWGWPAPPPSLNWGGTLPTPSTPLSVPPLHCIFHTNISILLFLLIIKGRDQNHRQLCLLRQPIPHMLVQTA